MRVLVCCMVLFCALGLTARAETVGSIPRPPRGSWSVDTTRTLSFSTLSQVDRLGSGVDVGGTGQLAVVVVNTTEGRNPRSFATELFNRWGIGHPGRDDGALLFIALKDRKAEIVLGDGVDSSEDTARSDSLMSDEIVPAFKRGDADGAVLAGARGLRVLLMRSPLNEAPSQGSYDPGTSGWSRAGSVFSGNRSIWLYGGGAGALVIGIAGLRRWLRRRPRICEGCRQPRQLLDEREDDAHLDRGQRREERLGSVDYDVWWCESCQDAEVERYGAWFTSYSDCPRCDYKTSAESTRTIVEATYDHGGEVEVTVSCEHCGYHDQTTRWTPRRTRPSSSSSSSRSSFGGGRSSGGGSSGSW